MMGLGGEHSCFVSTGLKMLCFGNNEDGQLGYGDTNIRGECGGSYVADLNPIDLGTDFKVAQIQIMRFHNCVLSTRDELKLRSKANS